MVGKAIAEALGGDFEQVEEEENRKGMFGWIRGVWDAFTEKMTAIRRIQANVPAYDRIVIGTPVWAGKPAPAINMLIQMISLKGKTVDIYATMGGSPGNALLLMAKNIRSKDGEISDAIAIKTGGVPNEELIRRGREFGQSLKE